MSLRLSDSHRAYADRSNYTAGLEHGGAGFVCEEICCIEDISLSVLRKLNHDGCRESMSLLLSNDEEDNLRASAQKLKGAITSLPARIARAR